MSCTRSHAKTPPNFTAWLINQCAAAPWGPLPSPFSLFSVAESGDAGALLYSENIEKAAQALIYHLPLVVADRPMMLVAQPF